MIINSKLKYGGIGSRSTPTPVGVVMTQIATFLEHEGYVLRSGGAKGADTFFENGVIEIANKEIYLPEKDFGNHPSELFGVDEEAMTIASKIHPAWHNCNPFAKMLHARNVYQVLGFNLDDPSKFILCWTENGKPIGGTRTAIKLAEKHGIPVFNFGSVKSDRYMDAFENFYVFMVDA